MGMLPKLVILFFCINTFMYLGTSYMMGIDGATSPHAIRFQGDLFDLLLEDKTILSSDMDAYVTALESGENITLGRNYNLSNDFSTPPVLEENKITLGTLVTFGVDSLKIVFSFIKTLFNFVIAPITIFSYSKIPPLFAVIFGLPFVLLFALSLYSFIRSGQM